MNSNSIALLGGTFNPPHKTHVDMVKFALSTLGFDGVWVVPAADPPHKPVAGDVPAQVRLALTQLAFEGLPGVQVCGVELEREGKSYTWDTLTLLRGRFPKVKFSLLMGQDMLETIEQWYCAEQLLRTTPMVVYPRYGTAGGQDGLLKLVQRLRSVYSADVTVADFPVQPVSSTDLRLALAQGPLPRAVPAAVLREIVGRGLYGVRLDASRAKTQRERESIERLAGVLSEKRLNHSIAVMEEMERLSLHYGLEPERGRLAGLLHDCTKDETFENQLRLCREFDIILSNLEKRSPKLLHAITCAPVARHRFGLDDVQALEAIRYHTTGRAGMTLFDKLLYLADYVEPLRAFPGVEKVRAVVDDDLNRALALALDGTIAELLESGSLIHPDTLAARNDVLLAMEKEERHEV